MNTFFIELDPVAEKHLNDHVKAGNKKLLKKILNLFAELEKHPKTGTGKPHILKYQHSAMDVWSRKIDDRHRMLYIIHEQKVTVFVISLWGHYADK